jgi:Uma2 family endonuclease
MITQLRRGESSIRRVLPFSRTAEQTMGMPELAPEMVPRRGWTAAQVRDLIDESRPAPRYELIDGELLVTPSPGAPHQIAVSLIWDALHSYVRREGVGMAIVSPADIELVPENITQPDVFVVPSHIPGDPDKGVTWADIKTLVLVVEILSPSSVHNDRIVKRDFYMNAGVPEYWIVDLDARIVERWVPTSNTPQISVALLSWQPAGAQSPLLVNLEHLFDEIWSDYRKLRRQR